MAVPEHLKANQLMAGSVCPFCQNTIRLGDKIARCSDCRAILHEDCWAENNGCTSYGCPSAPGLDVGETFITREDIEEVSQPPKRLSFIALFCLVLALLGAFVEYFGMYIGAGAVLFGFVAFFDIRKHESLKGELLAVMGMILGLFDLIFWFVKSGLLR